MPQSEPGIGGEQEAGTLQEQARKQKLCVMKEVPDYLTSVVFED